MCVDKCTRTHARVHVHAHTTLPKEALTMPVGEVKEMKAGVGEGRVGGRGGG